MTPWPTVALGDVASITRRGVDPRGLSPDTRYIGLEHIPTGGGEAVMSTLGQHALLSTKFAFTDRHVLFGKLRPNLGKVTLPGHPGICSTDILPVLPGPRLDGRFLAWFLRRPETTAWAAGRAAGANLPRLSPTELGRLPLPLPPIEEQRRIAAILDQADALRTKRREALARLDTLTQSIFLDMFGDPVANPKRWRVATVGEVASRVTDGEHKTPQRQVDGVPLLSARNVRDGWIDLSVVDHVSTDTFQELRRRVEPQGGDILISCSGTIGRVARVVDDAPFAMVRSVALVRFTSEILPAFAEGLLRAPGLRNAMTERANSSAQANLFQHQIRALPVVIPPRDRQEEFAAIGKRVAAIREAARRAMAEVEALGSSLQAQAFHVGL